jgi:hypothetical protein
VDTKARRGWLAITRVRGRKAPDVNSLAAQTMVPAAFLEVVPPIIAPGMTLILTDLPVSP